MNAQILEASILGTQAFNAGLKSIPVLDKSFMAFLERESDSVDALLALNAWSEAWHNANLSKI